MLGAKIKEYLNTNGIKYSYVAEKAGIPMNILSPMLNEKREIKATEYFNICTVLSVPLEQFAEESTAENNKQAG